jgi:HNH endonuclease
MSRIPAALRRTVRERAGNVCEYCGLPDGMDIVPHEVDHVIAVKHGGQTDAENLAIACYLCNKHKGTDLASIDPESGAVALIYSPRRDVWTDHFSVEGARIVGRSPSGRATARLLQLNREERLAERMALERAGLLSLPPGATRTAR